MASCTCAGTARTGYWRRSSRRAGASGPLTSMRPRRNLTNAPAPGGTVPGMGAGQAEVPGCPGPAFGAFVRWCRCAGAGDHVQFDHVDAVVDAELGILLRCERKKAGRAPELTEFRSLSVDPVPDPEQFTAPPGSIISNGHGHLFGGSFSGVGWEIAKTSAGLAAGGLGATIRYSPFGPFGPLRPSRPPGPGDDDAEAAMPHDDPSPDAADGPPASDEVLHLLYRGGAEPPAFTATLHEWSDPRALLAAIPPSVRRAGFGGVGFLIDTLGAAARDSGEQQSVCHQVSSVRIEGWDSYRIDRTYRTPRQRARRERRDNEWLTVACDGRQTYQVYSDRVHIGPSAPPPAELTDLADGSWLLRCHLSGGSAIVAGDRRAYRISVSGSRSASPLMMFFFPRHRGAGRRVRAAAAAYLLQRRKARGPVRTARHYPRRRQRCRIRNSAGTADRRRILRRRPPAATAAGEPGHVGGEGRCGRYQTASRRQVRPPHVALTMPSAPPAPGKPTEFRRAESQAPRRVQQRWPALPGDGRLPAWDRGGEGGRNALCCRS